MLEIGGVIDTRRLLIRRLRGRDACLHRVLGKRDAGASADLLPECFEVVLALMSLSYTPFLPFKGGRD